MKKQVAPEGSPKHSRGPLFDDRQAQQQMEEAYEALLCGAPRVTLAKLEWLLFGHSGLNPIKARVAALGAQRIAGQKPDGCPAAHANEKAA